MFKEEKKLSTEILCWESLLEITEIYFDYIFELFQNINILVLEIPKKPNICLKVLVVFKEKGKSFKTASDNIVIDKKIIDELKYLNTGGGKFFHRSLKKSDFRKIYIKNRNVKDSKEEFFALKFQAKHKIDFYIEIIAEDTKDNFKDKLENIERMTQVFSFAIDYNIAFIELKNTNRMFEKSLSHILELLISLLELKDPYTFGHSINVKKISLLIAEELKLGEIVKNKIAISSILHDIGKIGISGTILQKPDSLSSNEFEELRKHPIKGALLLAHVPSFIDIAKIVMQHHERFDGTGYPMGLTGNSISIEVRIIALADAYGAITSQRPYRNKKDIQDAIKIIKSELGIHFDPVIVEAFLKTISPLNYKTNARIETLNRHEDTGKLIYRNILKESSDAELGMFKIS